MKSPKFAYTVCVHMDANGNLSIPYNKITSPEGEATAADMARIIGAAAGCVRYNLNRATALLAATGYTGQFNSIVSEVSKAVEENFNAQGDNRGIAGDTKRQPGEEAPAPAEEAGGAGQGEEEADADDPSG